MRAQVLRIAGLAVVVALASSPSFAQCDPLVVRYDGSNWWWGAFGKCKQRGGTTDRNAIFNCAWDQFPASERLQCLRPRLEVSEFTRQAIDDVAAFNGSANSCDQLMVRYDRSRWWWGAFGNCKQRGGTNDRNAIFNCAWNQVPASDQTICLRDRLRTTEFTREGIDDVAAFNGPANNCDQLMRKYDGSNWWWGAFGGCKRRGGPADREAILDCAFNQLPATERQQCLKDRLRQTEQTRRGIDSVAAANGVIASNFSTMQFQSVETCELPIDGSVPSGYFASQAPQDLLDQPATSGEGRLRSDLRAVARLADPMGCSLPLSAIHFGLGDTVQGKAFADLSVTGRRAFSAFGQGLPAENFCQGVADLTLPATCPAPSQMPARTEMIAGCRQALDRAYAVANYLRTGQSLQANPNKVAERDAFGWIAVSGEDDQPHRPVNVPSSDFPQYDIDVAVEAPLAQAPNTPVVTISTRFVIAQSRPPALAPVQPATLALDREPELMLSPGSRWRRDFSPSALRTPRWALRPEPAPVIGPNAEVLLYVHGMDSRAEEATGIIKALFKRMADLGSTKNLVIISMDLPTSGYASNLDYDVVSPLNVIGFPKFTQNPLPIPIPLEVYPIVVTFFATLALPAPPPIIPPWTNFPDFAASGRTPLLDFIETFIVRFADALDAQARFKGNVKAVIGGSLGGNMSFRLGRRPNLDWLPSVVVWSPASIWDSLGEGADIFKHLGPRGAWEKAANRDPSDLNDLGPGRLGVRGDFFGSWDKPIVPILVPRPQSETWASDFWPCKQSSIAAARLERQETYDALFQSWHWRLGGEQLLYSHQSSDPDLHVPRRYLANYKPMFLMCGTEDEVPFNNICSATQKTAPYMTMTPGKAVFLETTGHALDGERPGSLAQLIEEFLALR